MTWHRVSALGEHLQFLPALYPGPPFSGNSSIFIFSVLGVGVVDPTVGVGLSHRAVPSEFPVALVIEEWAYDPD